MGENLAEWAESKFQLECDEAGVTRNKSRDQDRSGWDYLIAFRPRGIANLPHDLQSGERTARVQIKSTVGRSPRTEIKLSNALHFCRETDPCFIVLYHKPARGTLEVYAREFDAELMTLALRRARQADHDGVANINRIRIPINFGPEDQHSHDLLGWIEQRSAEEPSIYAARKALLNKTIGFAAERLRGTISFPASTVEEFIEHSVGMRERAEIENVRLQDVRFDIPARTPLFDGRPDHFEMRVHPKPAELRFTGENGRRAAFKGECRAMNFPGAPAEYFRAKFTSPHVNATLSGRGPFNINFHFSSSERLPLKDQLNHASFAVASRTTMKSSLWIAGGGEFPLVSMEQSIANTWSEWFDEKYRALAQIARPADKPTLSDDDLGFQQHTVELFAQALAEGQIRLTATLILESPDCPTSVSSIMYYIHLTAGDWTYTAIIQRRTISEKLDGDQLSAEFGKPRILERAARRGPWERHEQKLRNRFKVLIGRAGAGVITLENGDFMALNRTGDLRISG